MDTIIERLDGKRYSLFELGIITRDFLVSAPSYRHTSDSIEGRPGAIDLGTTDDVRKISCSFYLKAQSIDTYAIERDNIFHIFQSEEEFYITDTRLPYKRWRVKCNNPYELDQLRFYGFFDVEFVACFPFAISTLNTLMPDFDLHAQNAAYSGMGLDWSNDLKYIHSTSKFKILNAGNVKINPRYIPLTIKYKGVSNNLSIKNLTTGDVWSYTKTTTENDTLLLAGIRSTKNSLSIVRETNRKLITLVPGWNEFELVGATGVFEIQFDFNFYYR
ncbi:phage tail family protein [Bacillus wiedmannii]|uniref:phage tail family protein n=1 Tax=Bacillus wiedmannii TaxID=1890302 RepID=UPI0024AE2603|nr:phage tail family protein [Bacillus wiedmannii]MDI6680179.1 phage tail family protein [Bacillus wiedmannii]